MNKKFLQVLILAILTTAFPNGNMKATIPEEEKSDPRCKACQDTCWEVFQAMANRLTARSNFLSADERGMEASEASNEWRACLEACETTFNLPKNSK